MVDVVELRQRLALALEEDQILFDTILTIRAHLDRLQQKARVVAGRQLWDYFGVPMPRGTIPDAKRAGVVIARIMKVLAIRQLQLHRRSLTSVTLRQLPNQFPNVLAGMLSKLMGTDTLFQPYDNTSGAFLCS